ncbi:MAG: fibronectin type III domain-containing protein [Flavobacteriales bacterium]|jgi:hypothetical protein|nr:fibronectin type III domain-containing protein [Flavobacteriales bacterium]MBT7482029.1 fibronectin type III domain-containing protein [Flavobacteriales bacterium]
MKKVILSISFIWFTSNIFSQCLNADSLYITNITYVNVQANWIAAPNADHYKIHYRELGTSNWSNLGNIDSTMTSRLIPMLQSQTTYEWEIETFCDSTNQNGSGWSYPDTFTTSIFVQCVNADSLYTNSITHENAIGNWNPPAGVNHYLVRVREIGTTNWSNFGNIDSTMTSRLIPLLQQQTTYEWQINTFCDSGNQPNSGWSVSDTFTTAAFIPAVFNPIFIPIIGNIQCNQNTPFSIRASQIQDEPDIASTVFWSDKGHFEISTLNGGDTVGNASYTSSFLNFNSIMIVDFTLGPNYAKIDLIDSLGVTMGFFLIENLSSGIKVSSIGPNDGNNYTNGYISQLNFIDLFVNPSSAGPITFTADINSELGDVLAEVDSSIIIVCNTSLISEVNNNKKLIKIVDILGRESKISKGNILFLIYKDGTVEKKYFLK